MGKICLKKNLIKFIFFFLIGLSTIFFFVSYLNKNTLKSKAAENKQAEFSQQVNVGDFIKFMDKYQVCSKWHKKMNDCNDMGGKYGCGYDTSNNLCLPWNDVYQNFRSYIYKLDNLDREKITEQQEKIIEFEKKERNLELEKLFFFGNQSLLIGKTCSRSNDCSMYEKCSSVESIETPGKYYCEIDLEIFSNFSTRDNFCQSFSSIFDCPTAGNILPINNPTAFYLSKYGPESYKTNYISLYSICDYDFFLIKCKGNKRTQIPQLTNSRSK